MFKCFVTKKDSKLGEKPIKVVIEKRLRAYNRRWKDEDGNIHDEIVSKGHEIVREVMMSKEGFDIWNEKFPNGAVVVNK